MYLDALPKTNDAERTSRLMAYASVGTFSVSHPSSARDARILGIDEGFTRLTGYTMEDLEGICNRQYFTLIHALDQEATEKYLELTLGEGEDFAQDYRLVGRDGRTRWVCEAGYVSHSPQKTRECILTDVTELHRYTDQIAQSEQLFRIANSVSGGAMYDFEFSTGSYLLFENAERIYKVPAERIIEETQWFGTLAPEKAIGAMADYFYHPDDVPMVLESFAQLQKNGIVHYVARSKRTDGTFLWTQIHIALIFDQDGCPVRRVGYILDIDSLKRNADRMSQSEQLFRITNRASGGAVFDYDFSTGCYLHFENAECIYGIPASRIISDTKWFGTLSPAKAQEAMIAYFYHPQDAEIVRDAFSRLADEHTVTYLARSKRFDGTFIWSKVYIALIFDEYGTPTRRVGHILNIDDMARQMERLKSQAQTDPLTGVYNKTATQSIVDTVLRKRDDAICALMILDVDNFKGVNDTFGHAVGDAVLVDVSRKLKEAFGEETLGRIGGDEFIIFAIDMESQAVVLEKAQRICQLFRQTFIGPKADYKISCSIGIAISDDTSKYMDLYKKADLALYQAKQQGKDQFCLYQ